MTALAKENVRPGMRFRCCDCDEVITGQEVLEGQFLFLVDLDWEHWETSVFRCESCQDLRDGPVFD